MDKNTYNLILGALEGIEDHTYDCIHDLAADLQEGGKFSQVELDRWNAILAALEVMRTKVKPCRCDELFRALEIYAPHHPLITNP